jgi:hypothetical protein
MWLWLDGEQPVAALCVWVRRGIWYSENASLSDDALEVTGWPASVWQPPATARKWRMTDDPVADSPAARQRTMREISRQFTASEAYRGQTFELRLLPKPLYTYKSMDRGIIDGAYLRWLTGTIQKSSSRSKRAPRGKTSDGTLPSSGFPARNCTSAWRRRRFGLLRRRSATNRSLTSRTLPSASWKRRSRY